MNDVKSNNRVLPRAAFLTELDEIPAAYQIVPAKVPHVFKRFLPQIDGMAAQGMEMAEIAARLRIAAFVLIDAAARFPDVAAAFTGGRARGADERLRARRLADRQCAGRLTAAEDEIGLRGRDHG